MANELGVARSPVNSGGPSDIPSHPLPSDLPYRRLTIYEVDQYKRQGFLKITGLAPAGDIARIKQIIDAIYASHGRQYGTIGSVVRFAPELRDTAVFRSCLAIAKQVMGRTTLFAGDNTLYKEPHGTHGTPWHQDGAFHGKYFPNNTVAFWIPLQDATLENGCLHYIPLHQHQVLLPHHPYYPNDYESMMTDEVNPAEAVACPLFAGDATVHGPLTPHSALPNNTEFIRRTWLLTFRPWGRWGFLAPSRLVQRGRQLYDRCLLRAGF
jgi:hypothetical protein